MVRLRYPHAVSLVFIYSRNGLGVHYNPYLHALLALLFGLCVVALVLTIVCDPGIIVASTKDELKPVSGIVALVQRFCLDKFP
jgi:hypothetical protein